MSLDVIFELVGTINTKASCGVTQLAPSITMFVSYLLCALFLALALDITVVESLDLGVVYATWSDVGTIAAALAGIFLYGERVSAVQWVGIVLTLVGVTLVNVSPEFRRTDSSNGYIASPDDYTLPSQYGSIKDLSANAG